MINACFQLYFQFITRLSFLSAAMRLFFPYVPRLKVVLSAASHLVFPWGSYEFIPMSGARIMATHWVRNGPHKHGILFPDHHLLHHQNLRKWQAMIDEILPGLQILFFNSSIRPHLNNIYILSGLFRQTTVNYDLPEWQIKSTPLSWSESAWISIFAGWNKRLAYICSVL